MTLDPKRLEAADHAHYRHCDPTARYADYFRVCSDAREERQDAMRIALEAYGVPELEATVRALKSLKESQEQIIANLNKKIQQLKIETSREEIDGLRQVNSILTDELAAAQKRIAELEKVSNSTGLSIADIAPPEDVEKAFRMLADHQSLCNDALKDIPFSEGVLPLGHRTKLSTTSSNPATSGHVDETNPCPYLITDPEGTSYCALAEKGRE